ncbi:hypothetical protein F4801DRAFT_536876 [Xylaria longipes]|nr:hypothetical protein F4801DRAFT_536876 [Xylaria longipes]
MNCSLEPGPLRSHDKLEFVHGLAMRDTKASISNLKRWRQQDDVRWGDLRRFSASTCSKISVMRPGREACLPLRQPIMPFSLSGCGDGCLSYCPRQRAVAKARVRSFHNMLIWVETLVRQWLYKPLSLLVLLSSSSFPLHRSPLARTLKRSFVGSVQSHCTARLGARLAMPARANFCFHFSPLPPGLFSANSIGASAPRTTRRLAQPRARAAWNHFFTTTGSPSGVIFFH